MSGITTHVLDVSKGKPAAQVPVVLEVLVKSDEWAEIARDTTNADGRVANMIPKDSTPKSGIYKLTFNTETYFHSSGTTGFYPHVSIVFEVKATNEHYHVPLL